MRLRELNKFKASYRTDARMIPKLVDLMLG